MQNTSNKINAGLLQAKCLISKEDNLQNIVELVNKYQIAAKSKLQLLVLPELHNGPYFCQNQSPEQFQRAESIPGTSTEILAELARHNNLVIVASIFEKALTGLYYNTAVVFDSNGDIVGKYRKMHIPHDPEYNEKYYFSPGDLGFKPVQTSIGKIGVLVCFDQWYPEAARIMALQGAEILVYPTAIGWCPEDIKEDKEKQLNAWQTIQRSHGIANNVFVISCNRAGLEEEEYPSNTQAPKKINFWGNSFIAGPQGEILNSLQTEENTIIAAELDLNLISKIRHVWQFFRDRRTDAYDLLLNKQGKS